MKGFLSAVVCSVALLGWADESKEGKGEVLEEDLEEALSLSASKAYALQNAPALKRQRLTLSNRVDAVIRARSVFDPVFQVNREWRDEDDPGRSTARINQTLPADVRATLSARYEEEDGGGFTRYALDLSKTILGGGSYAESMLPIRRAMTQEARQANSLSLDQRELMLRVTQRYYAVVRNLLTLQQRQIQLDRAKTNLEHAKIREDPLDIATAELRVPESELDVLRARRAIQEGLLDLKETIGKPIAEPMTVQTQLVFDVRNVDVDRDVEKALTSHERILNARLSKQLAEQEWDVAKARGLPELSVGVSVLDDEADERGQNVTGEIRLEWPLGDREDRAAAREAGRAFQQSEIEEFEARQTVRKDVKSTALRVEEAKRAVLLQEDRVRVLERQFLLYENRWDNGEISILEFVRSQNDLENARVLLITQQTRYLELLAEYDFVTGPE